jgi:hypothetical protein
MSQRCPKFITLCDAFDLYKVYDINFYVFNGASCNDVTSVCCRNETEQCACLRVEVQHQLLTTASIRYKLFARLKSCNQFKTTSSVSFHDFSILTVATRPTWRRANLVDFHLENRLLTATHTRTHARNTHSLLTEGSLNDDICLRQDIVWVGLCSLIG